MNVLTKLILTLATVVAIDTIIIPTATTQEIDADILCNKFPLNSQCEDYSVTISQPEIKQLDRNSFCEKFSLNTQCLNSAMQIIQFNLDCSGENDEWVRIEKQDDEVKLFHTTRVKDGLVSGIINGGLGAVPVPIPFDINKYDWEDHQVNKIAFKSDRTMY
ncbi:MAG: hypothetical protein AAGF83_04785 [Cyanobacteria bacterium P01_G01_bin.67]